MSYVFNKSELDHLHGLSAFGRYMSEDFYIAKQLHKTDRIQKCEHWYVNRYLDIDVECLEVNIRLASWLHINSSYGSVNIPLLQSCGWSACRITYENQFDIVWYILAICMNTCCTENNYATNYTLFRLPTVSTEQQTNIYISKCGYILCSI